jgi:ketosteroid isomerase-like protein
VTAGGTAADARTRTRSTIERYLAALNAHDADEAAACVAIDFHNEHTAALGTSVRGRDAYRARLPGFLAQFSGLRYDVEDLIVDGDRAAVPYRMTCRFTTDAGVAVPVEIRGIFRFRVVDGEIVHRVDYWDSAEFTRQVAAATEATEATEAMGT